MLVFKNIFVPLLLLFVVGPMPAQDAQKSGAVESLLDDGYSDWSLVSAGDGIEVYRRPSSLSSIDEVRIKATFATSLPIFLELIGDVDRYPEWVYKCSASELVRKKSDENLVYHATTNFPWPLQDRDLVVRSTRTTDPVTGVVTSVSTALPDLLSDVDGVVRIRQFTSVWKITPVADGEVYVDYRVLTDPAGKLPDWAINMGITSGPLKTMERLRKLVEAANSLTASR